MTNNPAGPTGPGRLATPAAHLGTASPGLIPVSRTFAMRFTSTPRGARLARHLTAVRLDAWGLPYGTDDHDAIVLIVAELTANAVLHGNVPGRDFHLRLALLPIGPRSVAVRVEVTDSRGSRSRRGHAYPGRRSPPSTKSAGASSWSPRSPPAGTGTHGRTARARRSGRSTRPRPNQMYICCIRGMSEPVIESMAEVRGHLADVIDPARREETPTIITRRGKQEAVVIDIEEYQRLRRLAEDAEESWLNRLADAAESEGMEGAVSLEEMAAMLRTDRD